MVAHPPGAVVEEEEEVEVVVGVVVAVDGEVEDGGEVPQWYLLLSPYLLHHLTCLG